MKVEVIGGDYEHTLTLSGTVGDMAFHYKPTPAPEIYRRLLGGEPIQACEFSIAGLLMMHDRGRTDYVAIPVYPNRAFRHGAILVRRPGSAEFIGASGLRIGVFDYSMTAAVWARALLDEFGIDWRSARWTVAGAQRFPLPSSLDASSVERDLEDMLAQADLDILIHPQSRDAQLPQSQRRFRSLFCDVRAAERGWYLRTQIYPVNHVVVIARELAERRPDMPSALLERYSMAKSDAMTRRIATTLLPWGRDEWREMLDLFDGDVLPYGMVAANTVALDTLARHLCDQELISKVPDWTNIFAP